MELDPYSRYLGWHWRKVLTMNNPMRHARNCHYCISMMRKLEELCQSLIGK